MDFALTADERDFVDEVRTWVEEHAVGEFAAYRGKGGMGREDIPFEVQIEWEKVMASGGWIGIDFPAEFGGLELPLNKQVLFHQTYVESRAPGRLANVGATLLGPTVLAYGTDELKQRFIPPILQMEELWCQGYSEPDAGSDLANVGTKARLDGDQWSITGQKIWTSLAQFSDWCFVVCRTEPESERHKGLSYLLVPMDQPGVEIRPIIQITGGTEFNEVFFDDARTDASMIVGEPGEGWAVAMGTLGFERGVSTLGQQTTFAQEFDELVGLAQRTGRSADPVIRQTLAEAYCELEILRYNNLRMLTVAVDGGVPGPEMSIGKLYWATFHRKLGEIGTTIRGAAAMAAEDVLPSERASGPGSTYQLGPLEKTFLYSRAHTIYGGSNQVQRNVIGERVLGLPREPR